MGDLTCAPASSCRYQDLPDQQARAFRLLSLWPGMDFHPWVLAAMLANDYDAAEGLVDGLVAAQLVEPAAIQGRYRMHDLLRLFATEQLDQQELAPDREVAWAELAQATVGLAYALDVALAPGTAPGVGRRDAHLTGGGAGLAGSRPGRADRGIRTSG